MTEEITSKQNELEDVAPEDVENEDIDEPMLVDEQEAEETEQIKAELKQRERDPDQ